MPAIPAPPIRTPFDFDGDGFCSAPSECPAGCDNCPFYSNPGQEDADGDGLGTRATTARTLANSGQEDADGDGIGDPCDNCVRSRARWIPTATGLRAWSTTVPTIANPGQEDADGDEHGDACDTCFGPGHGGHGRRRPLRRSRSLRHRPDPGLRDALRLHRDRAASPSTLYRINPTTGVGSPVGPMGISGCSGLAFDPTTDRPLRRRSGRYRSATRCGRSTPRPARRRWSVRPADSDDRHRVSLRRRAVLVHRSRRRRHAVDDHRQRDAARPLGTVRQRQRAHVRPERRPAARGPARA